MSLAAFTERYRKWCKRHGYNFSAAKAAEIHTEAQDQIAMLPKDAMTKLLVRQAIDALNAVSASLERLKAEMLKLASQLPEFPVVMALRSSGEPLLEVCTLLASCAPDWLAPGSTPAKAVMDPL